MDIKMKEVDDFTAATEILRNFSDAKILFVSNYTDSEFIAESEKIGALKLISKENLTALTDYIKNIVIKEVHL